MTDLILLAHGGGGELTKQLIDEHVLPKLGNPVLATLADGAEVGQLTGRVCVTTDASVVQPLFFPGGDIGRLAVSGTVNDLCMMGATPHVLTLSLIIEEGLPLSDLDRALDSVAKTAQEAGVRVVAGDTKVIERRGTGPSGLMMSTAGVGVVPEAVKLGVERVQDGDVLVISGSIAQHGMAIMAARDGLSMTSSVQSDVAPLREVVEVLLGLGDDLRFLRDPTRGGLAGVAVDIADGAGMDVTLDEKQIPVDIPVKHLAEALGIDPLSVANEGKLVAVVSPDAAPHAVDVLRAHSLGRQAAVIGQVRRSDDPLVELQTRAGGRRMVQRPYGEQLPRIC